MPRDFYEVLGVPRTATADEIKRAHRKLVKEFHPDQNKSAGAAERFREVQEAYEVLSDERKRGLYDQYGHAGLAGGGPGFEGAPGSGAGAGPGGQWRNVSPENLEEIFGGMGGFGDFFSGAAGGRRGARAGRGGAAGRGAGAGFGGFGEPGPPPADTMRETVDFMTAALGGTRSISVGGDGAAGRIDLKIPAGIVPGSKLRVAGKGRGGGDLLVEIDVAPHPWFRRDGLDILLDVPVTIVEASLGAKVDIPLLKGTVSLKIPAGTSSGRRIRVAGQGIASRSATGDFYAVPQIVAPASLSAEDESSLRDIGTRIADPRVGRWA
ncbi:MAG: J domain-containing protein [Phycisphaerales bacterium]|nr:J domain-containing protein [Phycisphaerales bacterium]